jgi:dGTPase
MHFLRRDLDNGCPSRSEAQVSELLLLHGSIVMPHPVKAFQRSTIADMGICWQCARCWWYTYLAVVALELYLSTGKEFTVLDWKQLLSTKRVKGLYGQESSTPIRGDLRTDFDRDYGRTVFSTPVRRLQDKAQVFPLERHDAIRTRLTHSMEVSSVSRSLGELAERLLFARGDLKSSRDRGVLGTIAATCGLVHDLGNPPFGHSGEAAISEWFRNKHKKTPKLFNGFDLFEKSSTPEQTQFARDFLAFEGNAQTQRLLSRLQVLADEFGLNLTCGTLSASCKYVAQSNTVDKRKQERKKHGHFASENDLISRIRGEVGTGESRNPIAFLVEAADDISYATVDLEDGVKKRVVTWDFAEKAFRDKLGKHNKSLNNALKKAHDKIDVANLQGQAKDEAMAVAFRTFAISEMVVETFKVFEGHYEEIMAGNYHGELLYESGAGALARECKALGFDFVYVSGETLKLELMGRKVIADLLDCYWEAARLFVPGKKLDGFPGKIYGLISTNYRQIFERNITEAATLKIPTNYFRMQLVTDQVSGMTDSYACSIHRELMNVG